MCTCILYTGAQKRIIYQIHDIYSQSRIYCHGSSTGATHYYAQFWLLDKRYAMLGLVICHNSDRLKAPDNYLAHVVETRLLAKCFLFFCCYMAKLIFPTLLISKTLYKIGTVSPPVGRVTCGSCHLYSLTLKETMPLKACRNTRGEVK